MNKLEVSIELSFDIDAGTIEPFDDVKLHANRLIHPEVFFERYRNYKMDLRSKAYIDATAQQVLKIAENVIKNVIKENDGCVRVAGKYIQELSKMLKATFDNLNEDFGIEAKFSDIAF